MRTMFALVIAVAASGQPRDSIEAKVDSLFVLASTGETKYQHLVEPARKQLIEMGGLAAPRLVEKLASKDARDRQALRDIISRMGEPAVGPLVAALSDTTARVRSLAADVLGLIGDARARQPLESALSDTSRSVRAAACESLGRIGDRASTTKLVAALSDTAESVRKSAAFGIGMMGDPSAMDALLFALEDQFFGVRYAASTALGKMDGVFRQLERVARDERRPDRVRALAMIALFKRDSNRARPVVESMLRDSSREVRATAVSILSREEDVPSRRALSAAAARERDPLIRSAIESALRTK